MKTIDKYFADAAGHQREGRNWSTVDHEHLRAWKAEIERLRKLIRCEQIKPPADVADDMTTEFAVELAVIKGEIERLQSELED